MGQPIEGGELIPLVEIDQDYCANIYGEGAGVDNLLTMTESFDKSIRWVRGFYSRAAGLSEVPPLPSDNGADKVYSVSGEATGDATVTYTGFPVTISTDYNFSVYMKAAGYQYGSITFENASFEPAKAVFDLENGTVASTVAGVATITDEGDGWYRCSIQCTSASGITPNRMKIGAWPNSTFTEFFGDGASGVYLWGAQVTQSSSIMTYEAVKGYGTCTAALSADTPRKCYNTLATCQDTDNYTKDSITLRFAKDQSILPLGKYIFPSLNSIKAAPSKLNTSSRASDSPLGVRASVSATFQDHPHTDRFVDPYADERLTGAAQFDGIGYDPYDKGSMWGKWRARNLYYLGRPMRVYDGVTLAANLETLTVRNYIIEKVDGPDASGRVTITGKDPLKLADNDRAQAPQASQGLISVAINDTDTSITLTPATIGDTYPASGFVAVGEEYMSFTRSGDVLTITRGEGGTVATAHSDGDTVQLALVYTGESVSDIVYDLLVNYANIPAEFITQADWDAEVTLYLTFAYTAAIVEPTAVKKLIGELAEQAGFSLWWDEVGQQIRLSVTKAPGLSAITLTDDDMLMGSVSVKDKPEYRISQVWTSYGLLTPFDSVDDSKSYRSTLATIDGDASSANQYGQEAVRKVFSRWIPPLAQSTAADLNDRLISRYRDMLRVITFDLPSHYADVIKMGDTHRVSTRYLQDENGDNYAMPIRVLSVEQNGDTITVDAEEIRFFSTPDPDDVRIIINSDINNVNLREAYDAQFVNPPAPTADIVCEILGGVVVGSANPSTPAFDVGDWSDYTYNSITVISYGRIAGAGGQGGRYGYGDSIPGEPGVAGGLALYTRTAITYDNQGKIYGGGGGGGGGAGFRSGLTFSRGGGGGGGAGRVAGSGGLGGSGGTVSAASGSLNTGGAGGAPEKNAGIGGAGGGPAQAGQAGQTKTGSGGAGGAAGQAVDGESYITYTTVGDILGARVN